MSLQHKQMWQVTMDIALIYLGKCCLRYIVLSGKIQWGTAAGG